MSTDPAPARPDVGDAARPEAGDAVRGETSVYLYGFVPGGTPAPPRDVAGVAGSAVEVLDAGVCGAAVSRVPAGEYAPGAVEARLEDLAWVAGHGLDHERVVTWFVDHAWILPARLLTLHSTPASLREEVEARRDEIARALAELEGLLEWDLKVSYDAGRLEAHLGDLSREIADLDEEIDGSAPGRGYLLGRVREERARDRVAAAARRVAEEVLEDLRAHAVDDVRLELPREGADLPVVLGAALLARPEQGERLRAAAGPRSEELAEKGIRIALSGPWAPYRFLGGRGGDGAGPGGSGADG